MSGYASSIGQIGRPYFDRHNNRVKGFCSYIITSPEMIYPYIKEARDIRDTYNASRITLRFVTKVPLEVEQIDRRDDVRIGFETELIPLAGEWEGYWLQYYGENNAERIELLNIIQQEESLISDCLKAAKYRDPFTRIIRNGYRIGLGTKNNELIKELYELYKIVYRDYTFQLTEKNVAELVKNSNSIVAVAIDKNESIVSVGIAEMVEIPINNRMLRICELSEEATHPNHRGKGLNQACVDFLIDEVLRRYGIDINLIYEEDRAVSRGVNQQSANLGFKYAGRLNKHCRMNADRDIEVEGPYEDLNVWYLSPENIYGRINAIPAYLLKG